MLPGITSPPTDGGNALHKVICGNLENLPPLQPTTVRIYLASNYEGTILSCLLFIFVLIDQNTKALYAPKGFGGGGGGESLIFFNTKQ